LVALPSPPLPSNVPSGVVSAVTPSWSMVREVVS